VTFGTKGKGTRVGTSPDPSVRNRRRLPRQCVWFVEGEGIDPKTEWIGLRNGRCSAAATSVGTRFKPPAWLPGSHRSGPEGTVTAKTPRASREAIAWGSDESVVLSRPAEPGASSSSASARFESSFADFWFVASRVGPFAEVGARYRVARPLEMATRKGPPLEVGRSAAREPAHECWASQAA